jgi:hypothetical protein
VIIPVVIQSLVNSSSLTLVSANIGSMSNSSFTATTVMKFSNINGPAVKFQMNTINIAWKEPDGTTSDHMVCMNNANSIVAKNNGQSTVTSTNDVLDDSTFADFNSYLMHHPSASWTLTGTADVTFIVQAAININKNVDLVGFNNFTVPPVIASTNLTNGTHTVLTSKAFATLTSLSNVQLSLNQDLYYHVYFMEERIGTGYLPYFTMYAQSSFQTDTFIDFSYSTDEQRLALMTLLSDYSSGIDVNATMTEFFMIPSIDWLAPALDSLSMTATLPASTQPMVIELRVYATHNNPLKLPFDMILYNPQTLPCIITELHGNLTYHDQEIARVDLVDITPPIVIEPLSNVTTQQFVSKSFINSASLDLLSKGSGLGNLFCVLIGNFSDFPIEFYYQQFNVSLVVF